VGVERFVDNRVNRFAYRLQVTRKTFKPIEFVAGLYPPIVPFFGRFALVGDAYARHVHGIGLDITNVLHHFEHFVSFFDEVVPMVIVEIAVWFVQLF
jgi:hypothetical protein